jgi:hypothetical protein
LKQKLEDATKDSISKMIKRHMAEEKEDNVAELHLVQRMVNLGNFHRTFPNSDDGVSSIDEQAQVEVDNDVLTEERSRAQRRDRALALARERVGRWDSKLSIAIMEAIEINDPNVRVEETTRDLRLVRKYAIGLRENLNRCLAAIKSLRSCYSAGGRPSDREAPSKTIYQRRSDFLSQAAKAYSGRLVVQAGHPKSASPSMALLATVGIDTTDPLGWSAAVKQKNQGTSKLPRGQVGERALAYFKARDAQTDWLLSSLHDLLVSYFDRVEVIEGFVYMECVGIQLEKHFSHKRASALTAFERKTDITAAMNVAHRKKLTKLVKELQEKLDKLGPDVSHTLVKQTKEVHLDSKQLKAELHELAVRRLTRARESSTERVVNLISLWAKEEENAAAAELKALGEAVANLEQAFGKYASGLVPL